MGGLDSGNWSRWPAKSVVGSGLTLDLYKLIRGWGLQPRSHYERDVDLDAIPFGRIHWLHRIFLRYDCPVVRVGSSAL